MREIVAMIVGEEFNGSSKIKDRGNKKIKDQMIVDVVTF